MAHRFVRVVDRDLHFGAQLGVVDDVGEISRGGSTGLFQPGGQRFGVQRDQGRDERPAVADDQALTDQPVRADTVLEHGGSDVLAGCRDDQFLLAPGDPHETVLINFADISCMEPAVGVDRVLRRRVVVPVAVEDQVGLEQQLAVVGHRHAHPADGAPDRTDPQRVRTVHAHAGGRLGQPVALVDGDADAVEEVAQPLAERRTAGDRRLAPTTQRGAQLAVHEPVEQRVLHLEHRRHRAAFLRLRVADRDALGEVEDLAVAPGVRLLLGRVVDLLEHARDAEHERRLERGEVGEQVLDVGGMPEHAARCQRADLDHAAEDVRDRDEQQGRGSRVEQLGKVAGDLVDLGDEVAV